MSDEVEDLLNRVTARGAPASLRHRVLSRVADELGVAPRPNNRYGLGWAVVVGIALAAALNIWVGKRHDHRLSDLYGPAPPSPAIEELSRAIESATDAETAQWFKRQLNSAKRKHNPDSLKREPMAVEAPSTH